MPLLSETDIPPEVKRLFASGQAGEINPVEFYQALKELGIGGVVATFYVAKGCRLPLEEAKRIVIEQEYGSVEAWVEPIIDSISELDTEDDH